MKYDVFISYSRKDYVDDDENIIKGNIVSRIKNLFKAKGITYWFDEDGIFHGDEFAGVIGRAIRESRVFLFISSVNSNASRWTSNEIATAHSLNKPIIPFRLDDSPYNDSVLMRISALDYIMCRDVDKALTKLITAVNHRINHNTTIIDRSDNATRSNVLKQVGDKTRGYNSQSDPIQPSNKQKKYRSLIINFLKLNKGWTIAISLFSLLLFVGIPISYYLLDQKDSVANTYNKSSQSRVATKTRSQSSNKIQLVDLGLPSGTLWADRNLGASSPNDTGNQYAWGEISTKTQYSDSNYSGKNLSVSCIIGNPKYDPSVSVNMQMPSAEQFRELLNHCSWLWIESYGRNGYRVRGKNGRSIFFPVTGWKATDRTEDTSNCGYYWSGDAANGKPGFAKELLIYSNGERIVGDGYKYYGRSIRPVARKK